MVSPEDGLAPAKQAEALLREHQNALVCALSADGLTTTLPRSVPLWGQTTLEGRALIDHVVASDRSTVITSWRKAIEEGRSQTRVRLSANQEHWMDLHFLDTRPEYGVLLGILIPTGEVADPVAVAHAQSEAAPRYATLLENERAEVIGCDEAFERMTGFTAQELIGKSVLNQIHPDDQARAVESWLAMLATKRVQQARMRRRRKDGSWLWVDVTMHNYLHDPDRGHALVELIDVSAEMAAQEAVEEREALLRSLVEAMPDGVMQIDTRRRVVFHNARLLEILRVTGKPSGGAAGALHTAQNCLGLILSTLTEASNLNFHLALAKVLADGVESEVECDFQTPQGEWRRALFYLRALQKGDGETSGALVTVLDVTDAARARQELERRATYDQLTHALNRASILTALSRELEGPSRHEVAVIYVDVDYFKQINDTLGHAAGDAVLVRLVERMRSALRDQDRIGRLGGDEFLILVRGLPEPQVACAIAERISHALEQPLVLPSGPYKVTASLGVAWAGGRQIQAEQLVEEADAAMYRSKQAREGKPVLAQAGLVRVEA